MNHLLLSALILGLCSCSSTSASRYPVQLLRGDSQLITKCKVLGHIYTDTRGGPLSFNDVAEAEFKRIAYEKYGADAAVVTSRKALPAGRIILEGNALRFDIQP